MARALALAAEADYRTSPNPMVGAVVLDAEGALAGEGFHRRAGEPHAEVEALKVAGARPRDGRPTRPWSPAKFGASLDGRIAPATGETRWITGGEARARVHRERHRHDAILVGINTVLADDPELTARFEGARQPLRVVLDS